MRNLKLRRFTQCSHDLIKGPGQLAESGMGDSLFYASGRSLWKFEDNFDSKNELGIERPNQWLNVGDIFVFEDDEVVSLSNDFSGLCAISKRGQIVRTNSCLNSNPIYTYIYI